MLTRWVRTFIAISLILGTLFTVPAAGDGSVVALAIAAALVFACIITLCIAAGAAGSPRMAILCALGGEDRRHRGAFRRQHAPNTPGRPGRPRSPGHALVGLAR